jgi:hypothetical protein
MFIEREDCRPDEAARERNHAIAERRHDDAHCYAAADDGAHEAGLVFQN